MDDFSIISLATTIIAMQTAQIIVLWMIFKETREAKYYK